MAEGVIPDLPPQSPASVKAYGTMESAEQPQGSSQPPTRRAYIAIATLCHLNLVNYMDWFLVAGVLLDIQKFFNLTDQTTGLLHTVFILCFLFSAPVFGYLGDRYNQKIILSIGISFWSTVTFCSSFIPASMPWLFFISRGLVGAGTSSYSTIAPTIIADLFEKDYRTWMLSVFYIFIPVGSGLGYILSSGVARASGFWGWGFRVTPFMGITGLILLIILVPKPKNKTLIAGKSTRTSTWLKDISSLCKKAEVVLNILQPCSKDPCENHNSEIFGGITIATGILGVVIGAEAARRYKKVNTKADPLICAVGLLSSSPCMYLAIMLAGKSIVAAYIFIALAVFFLSLNWAVVADILLYVVKPACQSTALSLQIFMSHLLGDAGSPYLIGIIANTIKVYQRDNSTLWDFQSLKYSFVVCIFVGVLGGGCFLLTAIHIEEDSKKAAAPTTPPATSGQGIENKSYDFQGEWQPDISTFIPTSVLAKKEKA
ncbi:protein spinster homolog 3-like isoform X2 [Pantherophis guttatus]|uniref:Protein spinster homolog 3-like isoform X2 n=1 Tax=Pantherophis guttatus TaxID=94885 RepID=A0A6P9CBI5_PANGU|nr:protein spinster homolog 3-like isoform X2 [Pantherophis guttatus]